MSAQHDRLELAGQRLERGRVEVRVLGGAVGLLGGVEGVVEALALHVHDDPPEHLDEAAVGVPAEPLVAGQGHEAVQRLLVEAQVEDRVHHPGHRELGAGPDAHEERIRRVPEALAGLRLDLLDRLEDVRPEALGQLLAGREVVVAGLGRDREAGRDRQTRVRHLGQAGALAAEQVAHRRIAFGGAPAPGVDVALGGLVGSVAGGGRRGRHGVGILRTGRRPLAGRVVSALWAPIVPSPLRAHRVAHRLRPPGATARPHASAAGTMLGMTDIAADSVDERVIEPEDERYNARLVRRDDQHASLGYFWVRFDGEPTPFEPGQYMTIGVFVDGKIVQRPYSVASAPATAGDRRLRDVHPPRPGRHVHAAALAAAGRRPDADDRPEGQVRPRARRRPDPPVHLVRAPATRRSSR